MLNAINWLFTIPGSGNCGLLFRCLFVFIAHCLFVACKDAITRVSFRLVLMKSDTVLYQTLSITCCPFVFNAYCLLLIALFSPFKTLLVHEAATC